MKITIYNYGYKPGQKISLEIECKGEGTKENPIIIEPSDKIPKKFIVRVSKYHLVLKGFTSRYIFLEQCKNIVIEDTELNCLRMIHCSNIIIKNLTCFSRLALFRCEDVTIENSFIGRLRLFNSSDSSIVKSYIIRLMDIGSKNNNMELSVIRKVQKNLSLNYWVTEYNNCFIGLLIGFFFFLSMVFLPIGLMSVDSRDIIYSVLFSMLGVIIGVFVAVIIFICIVQPVLNRQNRRLIEEEKLNR